MKELNNERIIMTETKEGLTENKGIDIGGYGIQELSSFPPNVNPFDHDQSRMGIAIGSNLMAMMMNHTDKSCGVLVLADRPTGKRIVITPPSTDKKQLPAEKEPPLNPKRHFYLYAKGHYHRSDDMKFDLACIVKAYAGVDYASMEDILTLLNSEVYPQVAKNENTFWAFWKGCAPRYEFVEYHRRVMVKMLSILAMVATLDDEGNTILNLGEPDPNILPLYNMKEDL